MDVTGATVSAIESGTTDVLHTHDLSSGVRRHLGRDGVGGVRQVTTPQKAKGSAFERDVAKYLADHGFPYAERRYGAGNTMDKGDINGLPGLVVECKNTQRIDIPGFLQEAEIERANAKADYGIAVVKRRGTGDAGQSYVLMTLESFARLWKERDD